VFLVAGLAVLAGIANLLAFFGGWWWMFDILATFRPQLSVLLAVTAGLLALRRWYRTAAFTTLVLGINLIVIIPLFIGPARPERTDVRILSFNVLWDNPNFGEVIGYIRESKADVVVLHETTELWEEALNAAALPYEITIVRESGDSFGAAVLAPSSSEIESFGLGLTDPRAVAISLEQGLAVLAIHPLSPYTRARAETRDEQFEFANRWVIDQSGPVIVVGDFNAGPWSYPFRRMVADTGLHDSARGFGLEFSYPAGSSPLVQIAIDHLLYSDGLAVRDRRLGPAMGSDHLPLTVDLAFSSGG
jgi:endonuclease/exonuclease/phosphatase (EEP) superfamily protein YafD